VEDFFHPDRIVIGVESARAAAQLQEIYEPIVNQTFHCPVHGLTCDPRMAVPLVLTDVNSAELIKHASNSFLAMKISFINLVADLCEAAGGDIAKVAEGIGRDRRIGHAFLRPGIGFGGSCFPKDLQAFVRVAGKFGCDFSLFEEVERVNSRRIDLFIEKIVKELWVLSGKTVAVWGLAYKPNTDDLRCAPALEIIRRLLASGASVQAYDPRAMDKARVQLPNVAYCRDPYEAAESASAILTLTEWEEFHYIDWERMLGLVQRPLIFDARNMFSREKLTSNGFHYVGMGVGESKTVLDAVESTV
jgi:UDPglucose 6-dehydrogenase